MVDEITRLIDLTCHDLAKELHLDDRLLIGVDPDYIGRLHNIRKIRVAGYLGEKVMQSLGTH